MDLLRSLPRSLPAARHWLIWAAAVLLSACGVAGFAADAPAPQPAAPQGFKHRGFYLHEGWLFKHPFAVRSWKREDFAAMYQLLERLGFDRVMNWPMFESIPAPLSETDAQALRDYRRTIDDAHAAGLEFWLVQCANLTPLPSIAAKPWKERNPYPVWKHVRLDDPAEAAAYFAHRRAMMEIVNTADAYVTIDGDPGGYPGAKPQEWLAVFRADRATLDAVGKTAAKRAGSSRVGSEGTSTSSRPRWRAAAGFWGRSRSLLDPPPRPPPASPPPHGPSWAGGRCTAT